MVIARALVDAVRAVGHDAELVTTPSNPFGQQASEYLTTWRTNVREIGGRRVDHVISLRYPSYAVRHRSHVCWLNHTMREYYDLWEEFSGPLSPQGRLKESVRRRLIHAADTEAGRAARDAMIALVTEKGPEAVADAMMPKLIGETTNREQPELGDAGRSAR